MIKAVAASGAPGTGFKAELLAFKDGKLDPSAVQCFEADVAMALKFSFPRPSVSGSLDDTDLFGGQFHSPLVRLEMP